MPHTENILPGGRYAVVSCHVERPLDDEVWDRFSALQARRPGGFRIAALMRPPDQAAGEDEILWLGRAQAAAERRPLGLHTHWTAPDRAGLGLPRRETLAGGSRAASARLATREDDVVREQRAVNRHEAARDEVDVRLVEVL